MDKDKDRKTPEEEADELESKMEDRESAEAIVRGTVLQEAVHANQTQAGKEDLQGLVNIGIRKTTYVRMVPGARIELATPAFSGRTVLAH